jgi:hypothetical protein
MFKLTKVDFYTWPVKVKFPCDGGKFSEETFDATFKRLPISQIQELLKLEGMTDAKMCKEVMIGWKGIVDDNKSEIPFSEDAMEKLLEFPLVASAVISAYLDSTIGGEAKRKNL